MSTETQTRIASGPGNEGCQYGAYAKSAQYTDFAVPDLDSTLASSFGSATDISLPWSSINPLDTSITRWEEGTHKKRRKTSSPDVWSTTNDSSASTAFEALTKSECDSRYSSLCGEQTTDRFDGFNEASLLSMFAGTSEQPLFSGGGLFTSEELQAFAGEAGGSTHGDTLLAGLSLPDSTLGSASSELLAALRTPPSLEQSTTCKDEARDSDSSSYLYESGSESGGFGSRGGQSKGGRRIGSDSSSSPSSSSNSSCSDLAISQRPELNEEALEELNEITALLADKDNAKMALEYRENISFPLGEGGRELLRACLNVRGCKGRQLQGASVSSLLALAKQWGLWNVAIRIKIERTTGRLCKHHDAFVRFKANQSQMRKFVKKEYMHTERDNDGKIKNIEYSENRKITLGKEGREELRAQLRRLHEKHADTMDELLEKYGFKYSELRNATVQQLSRMAFVCNLWDQVVNACRKQEAKKDCRAKELENGCGRRRRRGAENSLPSAPEHLALPSSDSVDDYRPAPPVNHCPPTPATPVSLFEVGSDASALLQQVGSHGPQPKRELITRVPPPDIYDNRFEFLESRFRQEEQEEAALVARYLMDEASPRCFGGSVDQSFGLFGEPAMPPPAQPDGNNTDTQASFQCLRSLFVFDGVSPSIAVTL